MRGQKGGLRDWLITNKIINLNIKKKNQDEEEKIVKKNKEEQKLKKIYNSLKNKTKNVPKTASVINKLEVNKKGKDTDIEILDKVMVTDENSVDLDVKSEPITIVSTDEVIKIKNDIKKGIEQYQSEKIIIGKVNGIVSKLKQEVEIINKDMQKLETEIKSEIDTRKIGQYEQRLIVIQEKIVLLQRKYNIIFENTDFIYFDELENEELLDEISNYKFIVDSTEMVYDLAKDCRDKIDELNEVVEIYDKKKIIEKQKNAKKKELQQRDEDFYFHENKINTMANINKTIKENYNNQQEFMENLQIKISKTENKYKDVERLRGLNKLSYNLLKFSFLMKTVKQQKIALPIALLMFNNSIKDINGTLVSNKKQKIFSEYKGLNEELCNGKMELDDIEGLIYSSLSQIEKIKKDFNYKFSKYQEVLPEYNNISKRLNLIIKQLKVKEEEIKKMKNKVSNQYEKNKVKIKKMEAA